VQDLLFLKSLECLKMFEGVVGKVCKLGKLQYLVRLMERKVP
jgi:hypothetical protein